MKIYVGNLSFNTDGAALKTSFSEFGEVSTAEVVADRETGKSRGFGFVEMPVQAAAEAAIKGLNGKEVDGRALNVNEARPKADSGDRGNRGSYSGARRW